MLRLSLLLLLCCLLSLSLLLLAARASAVVRGGAISGPACAKTRVLARSSPEIGFAFCFRIGFCGVSNRKMRHLAGYTVQKHAEPSISHSFFLFSYVCRMSHRFLRCFCRLSTFCTCRLTLRFVFQLRAGVGRGGERGS